MPTPLEELCALAMERNPNAVALHRAGKMGLPTLVGWVVKKSNGSLDPKEVTLALTKLLAAPMHEITSDGVTVWVNTPKGLLGRFGRFGIDIHRDPAEQGDLDECLFCTHGPTYEEDWRTFQAKMLEIFGIVVSNSYRPAHCKE